MPELRSAAIGSDGQLFGADMNVNELIQRLKELLPYVDLMQPQRFVGGGSRLVITSDPEWKYCELVGDPENIAQLLSEIERLQKISICPWCRGVSEWIECGCGYEKGDPLPAQIGKAIEELKLAREANANVPQTLKPVAEDALISEEEL